LVAPKKEALTNARAFKDLPLMVAPSTRVAPAGRREECVSDQRVGNAYRDSHSNQKEGPDTLAGSRPKFASENGRS